jgi:hypothetical protein
MAFIPPSRTSTTPEGGTGDSLERIALYYKAVAALLIALLTGLVSPVDGALVDGDPDLFDRVLVAGGTVFAVPNASPPPPAPTRKARPK